MKQKRKGWMEYEKNDNFLCGLLKVIISKKSFHLFIKNFGDLRIVGDLGATIIGSFLINTYRELICGFRKLICLD